MRVLRRLASLTLSFLFLLIITFIISKYGLGNPLAGLGSRGYLTQAQEEELKRSFKLNETLPSSLLDFIASALRGGPPSLTYGSPSLTLALPYLYSTLLILIPSYVLSVLVAIALAILLGFKSNKLLDAIAFVPEYLYATLFYLSSWGLGWPNPLPSIDLSKVIAYAMVIMCSQSPRLLQGLIGLFEDSRAELSEVITLLKAMGLSSIKVKVKVLRILLAPFISYVLYDFAMLIERTVIIEPFLSFPGIGALLYNAVVEADVFLSATSFLLLGALSLLIASLSPLAEATLDPRVRR